MVTDTQIVEQTIVLLQDTWAPSVHGVPPAGKLCALMALGEVVSTLFGEANTAEEYAAKRGARNRIVDLVAKHLPAYDDRRRASTQVMDWNDEQTSIELIVQLYQQVLADLKEA